MTIDRYVLVDQDDYEQDHEYERYDEAQAAAEALSTPHAVIVRHYTYEDSELVWTPNGRNTWPPKRASRLR